MKPSIETHCGPRRVLPKGLHSCSLSPNPHKELLAEELPLSSFLRGEGKSPPCGGSGRGDWRGLCDLAALPLSIHGICPPLEGDKGLEGAEMDLGSLATLRE